MLVSVPGITQWVRVANSDPFVLRGTAYDNPVLIVIANPGLVCRASGEAIPCSRSDKVHVVYFAKGMAS